MRRFITISIILVTIAAIILVTMWLIARNNTQSTTSPSLTFREFLTGTSSRGNSQGDTSNGLSSEFDTPQSPSTPTQDPTGSLTPTNNPSLNGSLSAPGTQVSTFTTDTYTPNLQGTSGGTGSNSVPTPSSGGGTGTPTTTTPPSGPTTSSPNGSTNTGIPVYVPPTSTVSTTTPTPGTSTPTNPSSVPQCSEADVTITFTPSELAELKSLERRFYTIAESIRTDEDLAREVTNHDTFLIKEQQTLELLNYCKQKTPLLANPLYQRRVPTPFWYETGTVGGFIVDGHNDTLPINNFNSFTYGKRRLEYSLRLNLW